MVQLAVVAREHMEGAPAIVEHWLVGRPEQGTLECTSSQIAVRRAQSCANAVRRFAEIEERASLLFGQLVDLATGGAGPG